MYAQKKTKASSYQWDWFANFQFDRSSSLFKFQKFVIYMFPQVVNSCHRRIIQATPSSMGLNYFLRDLDLSDIYRWINAICFCQWTKSFNFRDHDLGYPDKELAKTATAAGLAPVTTLTTGLMVILQSHGVWWCDHNIWSVIEVWLCAWTLTRSRTGTWWGERNHSSTGFMALLQRFHYWWCFDPTRILLGQWKQILGGVHTA